jgi:hypothetical protein
MSTLLNDNGLQFFGNPSSQNPVWQGPLNSIAFDENGIKAKLLNLEQPCYVVRKQSRIGITNEGELGDANTPAEIETLTAVPPLLPQPFQTLMFLERSHLFGYYNPKQLADYLNISHQRLYEHLKEFSLYSLKKMRLQFMVSLAASLLRPLIEKSSATISRAGVSLSVDNSVIDSEGKMIRCTYSWYSGRWKKVVNGNDLLGIVLTINGIAIPLPLIFGSKQGRGNTDKPSLLLSMLTVLKEEFKKQGIDITVFPITLDSWFVSKELK